MWLLSPCLTRYKLVHWTLSSGSLWTLLAMCLMLGRMQASGAQMRCVHVLLKPSQVKLQSTRQPRVLHIPHSILPPPKTSTHHPQPEPSLKFMKMGPTFTLICTCMFKAQPTSDTPTVTCTDPLTYRVKTATPYKFHSSPFSWQWTFLKFPWFVCWFVFVVGGGGWF